jgi:hypothetical protein
MAFLPFKANSVLLVNADTVFILLATLQALQLAFAGSKFANRLKPLLAMGLRRVAILVVLLQIWVLF